MNNRVTNSIPSNKTLHSSNEDDPVLEKLITMIKKQQQLLDRIEFYIFKIEKKKLEKEELRKKQVFLGNKRINSKSESENQNDNKIRNTINKILELPYNNNVRKSDKHLDIIKCNEERPEIKHEVNNKNIFDLNFSGNYENSHQNNSNEEFEFFFQKNNFDDIFNQNIIFENDDK